MWSAPKKLMVVSSDFEMKSASLCCQDFCATLLQSIISLSFRLRIVIHLKPWIPDFLSFKTICGLPKNITKIHSNFKLKMMKRGYQVSQNKIFQESFFSLKTPWKLMKETSRSLLFYFEASE